jgi:hypothetical protein
MVRLPLVGIEDDSLCRQKTFLRMGGYWAPHRLPLVGDRQGVKRGPNKNPLDTGGLLMEAAPVRKRCSEIETTAATHAPGTTPPTVHSSSKA